MRHHDEQQHPDRILVVGRSPDVLLDTVDLLRAKGYAADATNQFDRVLDDYDVHDLDVLVFGGMVPADTKQLLREEVSERNPGVTFVQGLAGIAGVIAAQVEATVSAKGTPSIDARYYAEARSVRLTLWHAARVTIEAWWATSMTPPQPRSTSMRVFEGELEPGSHDIPLPAQVPSEASFATVAVDALVRVLTVGPMPPAVTRMAPRSAADHHLPVVTPVTTHLPGPAGSCAPPSRGASIDHGAHSSTRDPG